MARGVRRVSSALAGVGLLITYSAWLHPMVSEPLDGVSRAAFSARGPGLWARAAVLATVDVPPEVRPPEDGPVVAPAEPVPVPVIAATPAVPAMIAVPSIVLDAYRQAAERLAAEDPSCGLRWQILAGIGKIESDHARGGRVTSGGDAVPRILGPVLNGEGSVAAISDHDDGRFDLDPVWDRAVGPMQFIPGTWNLFGADGSGDGVTDPNNIYDATLAAGRYLCAGDGDLRTDAGLRAALRRYNNSAVYVANVMSWIRAYDTGQAIAVDDTDPRIVPTAPTASASHSATASPAPTPGATQPVSPTPAPSSATPSPTPTTSATPTPTTSATPTPTTSPTPTPTTSPTSPSPTPTPSTSEPTTSTPTTSATPSPTATPTESSATHCPTGTATPSPTPDVTPSPEPTPTATPTPSPPADTDPTSADCPP